jgi:hypothetical protein
MRLGIHSLTKKGIPSNPGGPSGPSQAAVNTLKITKTNKVVRCLISKSFKFYPHFKKSAKFANGRNFKLFFETLAIIVY